MSSPHCGLHQLLGNPQFAPATGVIELAAIRKLQLSSAQLSYPLPTTSANQQTEPHPVAGFREIAEDQSGSASFLLNGKLPLQLRLDAYDVVSGRRPGARVLVRNETEALAVAEYVVAYRCDLAVSRGVLCHNCTQQGFADWLTDQGEERTVALYLHATLEQAEKLREADESADDVRFGIALGYPVCCVERAAKFGVSAIAETPAAFASHEQTFDPLLWPPAMLMDRSLLPHIPCGPNCNASRQIALARLQSLRRDALPLFALLCNSVRWHYRQDAKGIISKWNPDEQAELEKGTVYYPLAVRELA